MTAWRCPECQVELVSGRDGNVRWTARRNDYGYLDINLKTGKPNFDAHCKACGAPVSQLERSRRNHPVA